MGAPVPAVGQPAPPPAARPHRAARAGFNAGFAGGRGLRRVAAPVASGVQGGAGFLLALITWGWVVMPFLEGGPAQIHKVLKAKFLNRAPDGSWLP